MRTGARLAALLAVGTMLVAGPVEAQIEWGLDLRAGAGVPTDETLGEADLEAGFGFDGSVALRVVSELWAYGGWGWHQFSADAVAWGPDTDVEQTGYRFGLRWEPAVVESVAVRLEGGVTLEHLEVEDADGDLITDTDHGAGLELGGGLVLPAWGGWSLTPGVRYRILSRELPFGDFEPEVTLEYVALEIGLSRTF